MIILYDENEHSFTSLGIGVLRDVSSCIVIEELNGAFELEMEYPITGAHYKDIKEKRLILVPPNEFVQSQPFRIYKITKPIDGVVTIYAEHISYDTARIPVKPIDAQNLSEAFEQIQNRTLIESRFKLIPGDDKNDSDISIKTKIPYSMRSLLAGQEGSILDTYTGDFTFDRYNIILNSRRGKDREFTIRYSKNMTDIEHETTSELIFNGVCPFYNSTTTETKTAMTKKYKDIYLSNTASDVVTRKDPITGETIYPADWLSYNNNGSGLPEILTLTISNIIATPEGGFYNHIVHAKKVKPVDCDEEDEYFYDVTYNMAFIDKSYTNEFGKGWLYKDEELSLLYEPEPNLRWNPEGLPTKDPGDGSKWWNPELNKDKIFRIFNDLDKMYKIYLWKFDAELNAYKYQEASTDDNIEEYGPSLLNVASETEEKDNIITYEGDIVYLNELRTQVRNNSTQFSSDWLNEVEETEETERWKIKDVVTPREGINYKVITEENVIIAYSIEGSINFSKDWLTLTEGGTEPLVPIDGQAYEVHKVKDSKDTGDKYYYRWYESKSLYDLMGNSKYTYKNYIWNGSQYVERNTVDDRILTIDLTDKFDETPINNSKFQKQLYDETVKYYKENKLGELKDSLKVSFVKLSSSPEYSKWKDLEHVELGDTVHVVYEELGINVIKKVTRTEYNVITNSYDSIELGEKSSNFVNNAVITGDNISSLTNDRNFADILTVSNIVAQRITADYIKAITAEITEAQISQLTSESITATLIEAERFEIDKLVAGLLVTDNAAIREQLTVGSGLIVNGEVNIKSGSISISGEEIINGAITAYVHDSENEYELYWLKANKNDTEALYPDTNLVYKVYSEDNLELGYFRYSTETYKYEPVEIQPDIKFTVDENGNVYANSLELDGGSINISNPDKGITFEVDNDGNVIANSLELTGGSINICNTEKGTIFEVDSDGNLTANNVDLKGKIVATEGDIGDCKIVNNHLEISTANITDTLSADKIEGGTISASEIMLGKILDADGKETGLYNFEVDSDGSVTIRNGDVTITTGEIMLGEIKDSDNNSTGQYNFSVNENGFICAKSIEITEGTLIDLNNIETEKLKVGNLVVENSINVGGPAVFSSSCEFQNTAIFKDGIKIGASKIELNTDSSFKIGERTIILEVGQSYNETSNISVVTFTFKTENKDLYPNDFGIVEFNVSVSVTFDGYWDKKNGTKLDEKRVISYYNYHIKFDCKLGTYSFTRTLRGYLGNLIYDGFGYNKITIDVKYDDSSLSSALLYIPNGILTEKIGMVDNSVTEAYIDNLNVEELRINSRLQYKIYAKTISVPKENLIEIKYLTIQSEIGGEWLSKSDIIAAVATPDYNSDDTKKRSYNISTYIGNYGIGVFNPIGEDINIFVIVVYK